MADFARLPVSDLPKVAMIPRGGKTLYARGDSGSSAGLKIPFMFQSTRAEI